MCLNAHCRTYVIFLSLKDALDAMKALGLNPAEQEMIDMTNEVNNNGLIYYPDFCKLVLRKYREESKGEIKNIKQNWAGNEIMKS